MTSQSPLDDDPTQEYLDGWLAVNRMVREGKSWSGREANCTHLNLGDGTFTDISSSSGLGFTDDARAFATTDWDHDGDLDLWIVNRTAPQVRFMRNDSAPDGNSVAFGLVGVNDNRDAIGARIDLAVGGRKLVRLLQAGSGYLSQSSKWVHFGVGRATRIDEAVIRWPDGSVERFRDVETGKRYRLTQGSGTLEVAGKSGSRTGLVLRASPQPVIEPTEVARIGLTWPVAVPPSAVRDFEGIERRIGDGQGPLLVNFWASWCASCVHELSAWTRARREIEGSGLRILALSVDEGAEDGSVDAAREMAAGIGLWFPAAFADDELIRMFEILQESVTDRRRPMPIPTSFLLDRRGRIVRIYKGPVELPTLLDDVGDLALEGLDAARAALPFSGRWYKGPHFPDVLRMADAFLQAERPELAAFYAREALQVMDPDDPRGERRRLRIAGVLGRAGNVLFVAGRNEEAAAALERSVELDPGTAATLYLLARLRHADRQLEASEGLLERATKLEPGFADAWHLLGVVRWMRDDHAGALDAYRTAVQTNPSLGGTWLALGILHITGGEFAAAGEAFARAVELEPASGAAWNGLGTARCRSGDRPGGSAALRRALEIDPGNERARTELASCGP